MLRSLEVAQSVARHIQIKQRQRGYDEATFVESFVLMNGVGGVCLDDFEQLRADVGLAEVNREVVREVGRRCPEQRIATIDQDATITESRKQEALRTYEGERGYQPMLAVWAEMNVVLADEFRDGNVPAAYQGLAVAKAAYAALPSTVKEFYYRGDSACHEHGLVDWLRDEKREGRPR